MSLDRAAIVRAALALLDEVGIEALSTRRLAERLGIKGPSLYWHFKNKGELLGHMSGALFVDALPPPDLKTEHFDWAEWLAKGARGIRRAALSHRDGARLMAGFTPRGVSSNFAFGDMVRTLQRSGLSETESQLTLLSLGRYAVGWVLYEQAAAPDRPVTAGDAGFEFGLDAFLAGLKARVKAIG